jgi:hypothetical protein
MQLFSRNVLMTGAPAEIMEFSSTLCAHVSATTGREISLWSTMFGAPAGSMTYTVRVEGIADLQDMTGKLMADADYHAKLAAGRHLLAAPPVDSLGEPIHGELAGVPPIGSAAMVTRATMSGGNYLAAAAWGVEIAQHVEKVAGVPTMFLRSVFGGFGDVAWIGVAADSAAVDAAAAKINGDADYINSVNGAAGLFVEGSGHRSLITRVA